MCTTLLKEKITVHGAYFIHSVSLSDENYGKRKQGIIYVMLLIMYMGTCQQANLLNTVIRHRSLELGRKFNVRKTFSA
jgi:hypothetical protein